MTKRLYILRHALALSASGGSDKERDLAPKGLEDAQALGRAMAGKNYRPDLALCSPALRTRKTCEAVLASLPDCTMELQESLYNAPAERIMDQIYMLDDAQESALVVAHNPGVPECVLWLSDPAYDIHLNHLTGGYQPATLSVLECPVSSWTDIRAQKNKLIDVMDTLDYNAPARPTRWM